MNAVKHKYGIKADLPSSPRDKNTLYICTDTGEIYKGDILISNKSDSVETLKQTFATKEEASSFVNVGVKNSLQEAINAIPYRVGLQVVTFTNKSTLKRKKVSMWFGGLFDGAKIAVSINGKQSATITVLGGDDVAMNRYVYDMLIQDEVISSCLYAHSFSSDYQTMIFTLNDGEGDAQVDWIGDSGISCHIKTSQQYSPVKNESYQLKYNTTEDSFFLDTANWESYTDSQDGDTWGTFD